MAPPFAFAAERAAALALASSAPFCGQFPAGRVDAPCRLPGPLTDLSGTPAGALALVQGGREGLERSDQLTPSLRQAKDAANSLRLERPPHPPGSWMRPRIASRRYPTLRNETWTTGDRQIWPDFKASSWHATCLTAAVNVAVYQRREPEKTLLYNVIRENLNTFLEYADARGGGPLPKYVRQEFFRFMDCGILARGVARVRCPGCGYDTVVGFS